MFLGHFCSSIVNNSFHRALLLENRLLLEDENFSNARVKFRVEWRLLLRILWPDTVSPRDDDTNDRTSWPPLTSETIRATFSMYCLSGGVIIMYNLRRSLFLLNSRALIHLPSSFMHLLSHREFYNHVKLNKSLFLLNSREWIHTYCSHYHSYHNPASTNTHNCTQTNSFPTEMLG